LDKHLRDSYKKKRLLATIDLILFANFASTQPRYLQGEILPTEFASRDADIEEDADLGEVNV
jgi:hypothetical protein